MGGKRALGEAQERPQAASSASEHAASSVEARQGKTFHDIASKDSAEARLGKRKGESSSSASEQTADTSGGSERNRVGAWLAGESLAISRSTPPASGGHESGGGERNGEKNRRPVAHRL